MPPKIAIVIDEQGNIEADFKGFEGNQCQFYEQRLRTLMQGYGILTKTRIQKKPAEQIAEEGKVQTRKGQWTKIKI